MGSRPAANFNNNTQVFRALKMWFTVAVILAAVPIVFGADSETVEEGSGNQIISECDLVSCQLLRDRIENLEAAVKSIVSALARQENELFSPVNAILERDPTLFAIISSSTAPHLDAVGAGYQSSASQLGKADHGPEKESALQLKGAVKCSLAHIWDIYNSENDKINSSGNIKASLIEGRMLKIEWAPIKTECFEFTSGVWIRVFLSGDQHPSSSEEAYLDVPMKCLKTQSNTAFSVTLPSPSSAINEDNTCSFELKDLIECRAYTVEVVPNYQSLKGKPLFTEIVIPSTKESNMGSLMNVSSHSKSLTLNWEDNSGCAPQLTSFNLKIDSDGVLNTKNVTSSSFKIPRSCLKQPTLRKNLFSVDLSSNHDCPLEWKPLDICRKYRLEMKSEYSNTWTSASSLQETFTGQHTWINVPVLASDQWQCTATQFYCSQISSNQKTQLFQEEYPDYDLDNLYTYRRQGLSYRSGCLDNSKICNGVADCASGIDELNCENQCSDGFKCGRQCITYDKLCDGEYNCLDGSDENYECEYTTVCKQITGNSGDFSSEKLSYGDFKVHSDRLSNVGKKTIILISVEPNYTIWLDFKKFHTIEKHVVKVYDGPYSTSRLLLSHSGTTKPPSVWSSSNDMYLEFPSYHGNQNQISYGISVFYTAINYHEVGQPSIRGIDCGGYVYGNGLVSSRNYAISDSNATDCIWFIESMRSEDTILLKRNLGSEPIITKFPSQDRFPIMTVYDGWSTSGQVLSDDRVFLKQTKTRRAIYSIGHKIMVIFTPPNITDVSLLSGNINRISWNAFTISATKNIQNLTGTVGTIKSPNYPAPYPHHADYRWNIKTEPNSKIRLLFALFETQEGSDFIHVYDGPTMNSSLLLQKSGSAFTPFTVNSTTNQMLVRFTSDDDTTLPGFLAVYSTY